MATVKAKQPARFQQACFSAFESEIKVSEYLSGNKIDLMNTMLVA